MNGVKFYGEKDYTHYSPPELSNVYQRIPWRDQSRARQVKSPKAIPAFPHGLQSFCFVTIASATGKY